MINQTQQALLLSDADLDTVAGGELIGGRGNDVVLGQDGSDLLLVNNGDGSDFYQLNKLGLFTNDL